MRAKAILLSLFLRAVILTPSAGAQDFEPNVRVDDGSYAAFRYFSDLASTPEGELFCVWSDNSSGGADNVYVSKSTDGAMSWSLSFQFNDNLYSQASCASISSDDLGNLYVVWLTGPDATKIFSTSSRNNGDTWSGPSQVNDDGRRLFQHGEPALAFNLEVGASISFSDCRGGEPHVYLTSERTTGISDDDSKTYLSPRQICRIESFPYPFNSTTKIIYRLPDLRSSSKHSLKIYDLTGRLVRTLFDGQFSVDSAGGVNQISWDSRDDGGEQVGSGLYLLRLECDEMKQTTKVVLIK
ncbi:MAG: FlgD immunoglobulin-like domain containing protein [Candidatus Zixiibacteriota bacterium]